jgi:membrane-bound hydrogenase subunit beta
MSANRTEEELKAAIVAAFPAVEASVRIERARRVWLDVDQASFRALFDHAVKELGFGILCIVTGLDEGENLGFIYHIADAGGTILNIHTTAPKSNPTIKTITDVFPAGHIYERELVDLLGAKVEGLEAGNRYPLPDIWPEGQYPLRKDWDPSVLDKTEGA